MPKPKQKSKPKVRQLQKYFVAGGSAFAVEYLLFVVLSSPVRLNVFIANSVSFVAGMATSFSLNRLWAFKKNRFRLRGHHQFALYASLAIVNLVLTNIGIGLLIHQGLQSMVAKLVVMVVIIAWNFVIFRRFIFAA